MADLTYYPPVASGGSDIDQDKLKHHYFAQLSPDGGHLVPGVLQQGQAPSVGRWVDVGAIRRRFAKRYFVQHTDFNTLVPGSLISASRLPAGKWKEVKVAGPSMPYHRVSLASPYFTVSWGNQFANNLDFVRDVMIPALELVYPDWENDPGDGKYADFYYFAGGFDDFVLDGEHMVAFNYEGFYLTILFVGSEVPGMDTAQIGGLQFNASNSVPNGLYSFVMGVYDDEQTEIVDYVVLENVVRMI